MPNPTRASHAVSSERSRAGVPLATMAQPPLDPVLPLPVETHVDDIVSQMSFIAHCDDSVHELRQFPVDGSQRYAPHCETTGGDVELVLVVPSAEQTPGGCTWQVPEMHTKPVAQSVVAAHETWQLLIAGLHAYGLHDFTAPGSQVPLPSQVLGADAVSPAHEAGAQIVDDPGCPAHVVRFMPSQLLALQVSAPAAQGVRAPCGTPVIAAQVPRVAPSHASHSPVHAELQQTPSTQNCERQTALPEHAAPFVARQVPATLAPALDGAHCIPLPQVAFPQHTPSVQKPLAQSVDAVHRSPSPGTGVHVSPLQKNPAAQSVVLAHVVLQAATSHWYAPHDFGAVLQVPPPSQVPVWYSVVPVQMFDPHVVDAVGK